MPQLSDAVTVFKLWIGAVAAHWIVMLAGALDSIGGILSLMTTVCESRLAFMQLSVATHKCFTVFLLLHVLSDTVRE